MRKVRYFHHYDETHLHLQVFIFYSSTCLCCVWFKWQATLLHNLKRIPPSGFSFLPIKAGQNAPGKKTREKEMNKRRRQPCFHLEGNSSKREAKGWIWIKCNSNFTHYALKEKDNAWFCLFCSPLSKWVSMEMGIAGCIFPIYSLCYS